ncbi:hypothetical protein H8959_001501, partial [Pygathrix nigripes]
MCLLLDIEAYLSREVTEEWHGPVPAAHRLTVRSHRCSPWTPRAVDAPGGRRAEQDTGQVPLLALLALNRAGSQAAHGKDNYGLFTVSQMLPGPSNLVVGLPWWGTGFSQASGGVVNKRMLRCGCNTCRAWGCEDLSWGELREDHPKEGGSSFRLKDDDLEEGEVKDPSDRKVRPRPTCRFFMKDVVTPLSTLLPPISNSIPFRGQVKGNCTWGMNCRFIHPGVNDKGNYSLITKADPFPPNGAPPLGPHPLMPANPWGGPVVDEILPPPPPEPPTESAWERGLRHAKEVLKKATIRKEQEPDFEEKRFTVTIGEDEREFDKENEAFRDWNSRIPRDVRDTVLEPYADPYYDYEIERFWRGGQYENFRVQYTETEPYHNYRERERERERENRQRERERERERDRERERRQRERERERERERDKERQRRKEEWERERAKRDEKDRQHRDRDREKEREKEKGKPKPRSPQPP